VPSDPGYFADGGTGVASDDNVLWGDVYWVDPAEGYAQGEPAVHLIADAELFTGSVPTFYGRYVGGDGSDNRQPLGTRYAGRYLDGGPFTGGTRLIVWRDTKSSAAAPVSCGAEPAWAPLEQAGALVFDEEENAQLLPASASRFPWAVQQVAVGSAELATTSPFGWFDLDLWHGATGLWGEVAQGWVVPVTSASGLYSVGLRAVRLDSACDY
jgi:hypothetical protein